MASEYMQTPEAVRPKPTYEALEKKVQVLEAKLNLMRTATLVNQMTSDAAFASCSDSEGFQIQGKTLEQEVNAARVKLARVRAHLEELQAPPSKHPVFISPAGTDGNCGCSIIGDCPRCAPVDQPDCEDCKPGTLCEIHMLPNQEF